MKLSALLLAATLGGLAAPLHAQDFPKAPIQLVNPYAAGGSGDIMARTIASAMSDVLGKQVIVLNKPGAGTTIGANFVAHSEPDGHTLLLSTVTPHVIMPSLTKVGYNGILDFTPLAMVVNIPNVLVVRSSLPINNLSDLVAYAKANPGKLTFGSVGIGSLPHLCGEMLKLAAGIDMLHVPYSGVAPATNDLLGGNIDIGCLNASPLLPHIESGKLRALAVASLKRADQLPAVPTLDELGFKGLELLTWWGITAPAKTPQPVIDKLATTILGVMKMPAIKERITAQGGEVFVMGPQEFAAYMKTDAERLVRLIKDARIRVE